MCGQAETSRPFLAGLLGQENTLESTMWITCLSEQMTLCASHAALQSDLCGGITVSRSCCAENPQDILNAEDLKTQACMPCCVLTALLPLCPALVESGGIEGVGAGISW